MRASQLDGSVQTKAEEPPCGHARLVAGVFIAGFCVFLQLYAPQPMLALFRSAFSVSEARVSLIVSATAFAVAIASPFVGMFADRVGRKRVIVPSLFALSAATLGCALAPSLNQLIFWRFIAGMCSPGVIAVTLAYISEEASPRRAGSVTSLYVTGTVLGGLTGRISAAYVAQHCSWRWAFALLAAMTFAGAFCAWAMLPRAQRFVPHASWREGLTTIGRHLQNGRLIATYLCGFSALFCHVGLFTYISFHLAAAPYSLSTSALGMVFLVYALGLVITPIAGRVIDRSGHRAGAMAAMVLIVGGAGIMLLSSLPLIIIGVAIASSGVFVMQSAASSHVGRSAGTARSAASGLYVACYYLGGSFGATALAIPWHLRGWPGVIATVVAVQAISAIATWRYFAPGPQHDAHADRQAIAL